MAFDITKIIASIEKASVTVPEEQLRMTGVHTGDATTSAIVEKRLREEVRKGVQNEMGIWVTPAFPKLIYVLEEDNITEDGKYWYLTELAAKYTAKRLVPDYISEKKMKELKEGNCFPVMGCRSALNPWKDENGNYKFYGRFNQGVVTINLVDVALSTGGAVS